MTLHGEDATVERHEEVAPPSTQVHPASSPAPTEPQYLLRGTVSCALEAVAHLLASTEGDGRYRRLEIPNVALLTADNGALVHVVLSARLSSGVRIFFGASDEPVDFPPELLDAHFALGVFLMQYANRPCDVTLRRSDDPPAGANLRMPLPHVLHLAARLRDEARRAQARKARAAARTSGGPL